MKIATKKQLVDFIEWLSGSFNPFTHNVYFNTPRQKDDDFEAILAYFHQQRIDFISTYQTEKAIIELIKDPNKYSENFELEFIDFFEVYKSNHDLNSITIALQTEMDKDVFNTLHLRLLSEIVEQ